MKFGTRLIHFDPAPGDANHPMATPIYQTATFEQEHADRFGAYDYSRSGNPTRSVLEHQLAALDGGARAFAFASGMAAITCVTRLLGAGDEILADFDLYGGTSRLFGSVLVRGGLRVTTADATNIEAFEQSITPATRMLYVESPTNPLLRILDLQALAALAKKRGLLFCVDASALTPYVRRPIEDGADIVVHSATKYLSGHSDVTAGMVVVRDETLAQQAYFHQNAEGSALAPFDCFLVLRGLKTLKLRIDAQQQSAAKIAVLLREHPQVTAVTYPGFGALLTFRAGSPDRAKQVAEGLTLFKIAVSFGSVTSTISLPAAMSHASVPEEQKRERQIPPDLLRLSIGIEDSDDLLADLVTQLDRLD